MIKIEEGVKGLIFDLDGTIADTMPIHYIAWRNAAARYGIDFTIELFYKLAGIPLYPTVEKLNEIYGTNIDPREMGDAKEKEFEDNLWRTQPIEPVVEVVKKYYGKLPIAVGTGGSTQIAWKTLKIVGVDTYVNALVSSEDVRNFKPHPETFLRCAELMNVKPEDCQVFEDGMLGMQAARTAGMKLVDVTEYYEVTVGKEILED